MFNPLIHLSFVFTGENINVTWSPDGNSIAVENKEDLVTFIAARNFKIKIEQPFKFEVNEIEWNKVSNLFFLTNEQGCIHILRVMMNCFQIFNLA